VAVMVVTAVVVAAVAVVAVVTAEALMCEGPGGSAPR